MRGFMLAAAVAVASGGGLASATTLINGSFEQPILPNVPFVVYNAGSTALIGWTIANGSVGNVGSVDHVLSYWQAADGLQSLDLNGSPIDGNTSTDQRARIYQDLATVPGQVYKVGFALSGNPALPVLNLGADRYYAVDVSAGDVYSNQFSYISHTNWTGDMQWASHSFSFIADSTTTRLQFDAIVPGVITLPDNTVIPAYYGPALDAVTLDPVPTPAAVGGGVALLGLLVIRRWRHMI